MSRATFLLSTVAAAIVGVSAGVVLAQTPGFTRTPLLDQPLSVAGRHGVALKVEIAPGAESGRHTHPGDEFEYVMEGDVRLEIDGQPAKTFKAGEVFFVPAGAVHNGHNAGSVKATLIGTMFAETGKPLTTPVK